MAEPRKDTGDALAELFVELVDHGVPPVLQGRTTGWVQPRDDDRDPQPFDPTMDRYAVGTNAVPEQRKPS